MAPLECRRDIAMLGLIHRTALGKGPPQFQQFFVKDKAGHLIDPRDQYSGRLLDRSALGLVRHYNRLTEECKRCPSVKTFQKQLQDILKSRAKSGDPDWKCTFSPRKAMR